MGFMDKARDAALKATAQAQQMAQQGQAKMQQAQQGRSQAQLFQALGEAVYAEQRHGGDPAAVQQALVALDSHFAAAAGPAPTGPPPAATGGAAAPGGDFTLDDL